MHDARRRGNPVSDVPVWATARLVLREWHDSDLEPFAALNADPAAALPGPPGSGVGARRDSTDSEQELATYGQIRARIRAIALSAPG